MNTFNPATSKQIVISGINFMKALQQHYGSDKGLEMFDKLREVLGDDVCGDILFGQLSGITAGILLRDCGPHKINIIKILRSHLGCSLIEAKNMSERVGELPVEQLDFYKIQLLAGELKREGAIIEH